MKTLSFVWTILLLIAFGYAAWAQKDVATQTNSWYTYTGNHRLSEQWGVHTEYQWRRHDWISKWQQSLLRLGLDYYFSDDNRVSAGYVWLIHFPYGEQPDEEQTTEHRIWEQWQFQHKIGKLELQHRYRLEQRFLEEPEEKERVLRNRIRYRAMVTLPLNKQELEANTLFISANVEPFLNFGKGVEMNILDQNRLYVGLGYQFSENGDLQVGYLNQYIVKEDGVQRENNNTLQVAVRYDLDFRK